MQAKLLHIFRRLIVVVVVGFLAACGSSSGGGDLFDTATPSWINAVFTSGVSAPTDRRDEAATDWTGSRTDSLDLINHGPEGDVLQIINSCASTINYAICVAKGSLPQPENGLSQCATDPFDTPTADLTFKSISPGALGDFINATEILDVNIFFCSTDDQLCTSATFCDRISCLLTP